MSGPNEITAQNLLRLIGTPAAPCIIDVRLEEDRAEHPNIIPTALCHSHTALETLPELCRDRDVVVICHKGRKLSHGVAAWLRAHQIRAEVLTGGQCEWVSSDLPRTAISALPASRIWVTRHRPKIDRIACPWLIRRFVDPGAVTLFVPPAEVMDVAARFDAIPFDVPDSDLTHQGPLCTFDAIISAYGLTFPALDRLATVIRAADTAQLDEVPQAAGLLAVSVGLSRLYRDDTAQLEAAMPVYDALYRWARDGFDETHDCPQVPSR